MKTVTLKQDKKWHDLLPIDADEKVLAVFSHHVLAYVGPFLMGLTVAVVLIGLALFTTTTTDIGGQALIPDQYHQVVMMLAVVLSIVTLIFTFIPIWLRSQEHIVLTDEAVIQVLQPALFAAKVSQTSLERLADVSVHSNFFGTIFGYATLVVETPGEQNNYDFAYLGDANNSARRIIEAQESFMIALEGGHLKPSLHPEKPEEPQQMTIDPAQYQAFLEFQKMQQAHKDRDGSKQQ